MNKVTYRKHVRHACLLLLVAMILLVMPVASSGKTPDGAPPAVETPCSGLTGAAFGLCNAYCEAQDCDVHARPSCAQLLANFSRITGMSSFPCDVVCGDEVVDEGEDCDPPGSLCPDEQRTCGMDCTCPEPFCGDGFVDPGEECDPASMFSTCRACQDDCTCATAGATCCVCGDNGGCLDPDGEACPAGCEAGSAETICSEVTGTCVVPQPVCCACAGVSCFDGLSPEECTAQSCVVAPVGQMCTINGCGGITIP